MIIAKHFLPRNKFLRLHSLSQQKEPKQDFETYFIIWILLLWESELSIDCVSFVIVRLSVSQARFIRPEKRQPGYYHRESELLDVFLLFHNVSQSRYIKISTQGGTIEGREKHINRYNVFFYPYRTISGWHASTLWQTGRWDGDDHRPASQARSDTRGVAAAAAAEAHTFVTQERRKKKYTQ